MDKQNNDLSFCHVVALYAGLLKGSHFKQNWDGRSPGRNILVKSGRNCFPSPETKVAAKTTGAGKLVIVDLIFPLAGDAASSCGPHVSITEQANEI